EPGVRAGGGGVWDVPGQPAGLRGPLTPRRPHSAPPSFCADSLDDALAALAVEDAHGEAAGVDRDVPEGRGAAQAPQGAGIEALVERARAPRRRGERPRDELVEGPVGRRVVADQLGEV